MQESCNPQTAFTLAAWDLCDQEANTYVIIVNQQLSADGVSGTTVFFFFPKRKLFTKQRSNQKCWIANHQLGNTDVRHITRHFLASCHYLKQRDFFQKFQGLAPSLLLSPSILSSLRPPQSPLKHLTRPAVTIAPRGGKSGGTDHKSLQRQ